MFTNDNEAEAIICVRASVGVGVNGVNMMDIHHTDSENDSDNVDSDNDDADTLPIESSDDASDCEQPPARRRRLC